MVNDHQEAEAAVDPAIDHVFIRPRGQQAMARGLAPFVKRQAQHNPAVETEDRDADGMLKDSLRQDLDDLVHRLAAADRAGVADHLHRLRGALRVFPSPRHQGWFDAIDQAMGEWQGSRVPDALETAVARARATLRSNA